VAVAGAGYLGRRVLEALRGQPTVALTRSPESAAAAQDFLATDLDSGEEDPIRLESPYALLYTIPPPGSGTDDPRLTALLSRLEPPPTRLVLVSTTGVYGDRDGERVTEAEPVEPLTDRAKRRVAAEASAERYCRENGTALVILRVPGIYGPGRLGLDRLARGGELLREADSGPGNRIHVDDLVTCCLAGLSDEAEAGIYNVGDGDHRSSTAFSLAVAELAGLPAPTLLSLDEAKASWSPMRLSFALESRQVDTGKMRSVLGVAPRYADPRTGIRASLEQDGA